MGRAGEGQAGDAGGGGVGRGLLRGERGAAGGCESPAGAEEGSGPGTPLWFPFRGARCRRALSFPGEMAAPPPLAWAVPGSRFARERIVIIIEGGRNKSKEAATQERAAPAARCGANRVRGAAGGDQACFPGRLARSPGAP